MRRDARTSACARLPEPAVPSVLEDASRRRASRAYSRGTVVVL